jgi:inorganic pyrophosphatase
MRDEEGEDMKLLCVPITDPNWNHFETLEDVPDQLCDEIEWFFSMYKNPEGKKVEVDGWASKEEAWKALEESRDRWCEHDEERKGEEDAAQG